MARTFVITGSASGLGEATANRLKEKGHKVIGVDLRNADVNVDLSSEQGRQDMVAQVSTLAPEGIDGVLTSAGSSDFERPGLVLGLNYFGTTATLEGLHPLLRGPGARCVAIASLALLVTNEKIDELENLCLEDDESKAVALAREYGMLAAYPASKRALTRWARKTAVKPEWAGAGKLLNIVAPGAFTTPMIQRSLAVPEQAEMIRKNSPIAVTDFAPAPVAAELIDFLLNFEGNYLVGQIHFIDGGSEAIIRPDNL